MYFLHLFKEKGRGEREKSIMLEKSNKFIIFAFYKIYKRGFFIEIKKQNNNI